MQQSCPIPAVFAKFVNYNVPEKSKHRKRPFGNMQYDVLSGIHRSLFSILQASFWQQEKWKQFHADVVSLARSIAQYYDYLNSQCKKVKLAHQSPTPVRSLADSMCVKYVKACQSSCLYRTHPYVYTVPVLCQKVMLQLSITRSVLGAYKSPIY